MARTWTDEEIAAKVREEREAVIECARVAAQWLPPPGYEKGGRGHEETMNLRRAVLRLRKYERMAAGRQRKGGRRGL